MNTKYSNDKATQILLALLKAHGIRKVIASPGTTNIAVVASMQYDPWFEMYSSVDERSAAYMACGISMSSGEPVVITCTEATASRNYYPGLTEAYYRKLPIIVITGTHGNDIIGHLHAQSIDRRKTPNDTIRFSININKIKDSNDEWQTIVNANKAILELRRHGGGPVHINLQEATGAGYNTNILPTVRKINRITYNDGFPSMENIQSVVVFIGSHKIFSKKEINAIELFCERHNGVVFCDHTSAYYGKYKVLNALLGSQEQQVRMQHPDLIVHIGEVSGEIYNTYRIFSKETWRVSEDGEIRDLFRNLTYVFEMSEEHFFTYYSNTDQVGQTSFYDYFSKAYRELCVSIPELPFSNIWIAQQLHDKIPSDSILHTSIFNSLRSWNFFTLPRGTQFNCNVGGFGIDGAMSTIIGASLVNPDKLHFCIIGDLAFFYDLNSLGNRHLGKNLRILLINNGVGTEFRNYDHPASYWGSSADRFIAAGGHFACKSKNLVRNYAENLGLEYISASTKEDFFEVCHQFTDPNIAVSIIFEIFTTPEDESEAIHLVRNIVKNERTVMDKVKGRLSRLADKIIK